MLPHDPHDPEAELVEHYSSKTDSVHLAREGGCKTFHRFDGSGVEAHYGSVCCLDKQGRLVITG